MIWTIKYLAVCLLIILGKCDAEPAMIAVDSEGCLVHRDSCYGPWSARVADSCGVTAIAARPDGSLLGVGKDEHLYTRDKLDGKWTLSKYTCSIQDVAVTSDGTVLGVDNKEKLVKLVDGKCEKVGKSKGAARIDVFADGKLLGMSKKGTLKEREAIEGKWQRSKTLGKGDKVMDISVQPDGTIYGINKSTLELQMVDEETGKWSDVMADTGNVISIASPGNLECLEKTTQPPTTKPKPGKPTICIRRS